jgi:transcriptional regulator with XRE-family HTH domain
MLTSIGKYLRKLRIDNGEVLRDMAQKLSVSSSFLSFVENGKKKMPQAWQERIKDIYQLSPAQQAEFDSAIAETSNTIELDLRTASDSERQLAISFARQFDSLDEETSRRILSLLKKSKPED